MRDPQLPLEQSLRRAELLTEGQNFRNAQVDMGKTCLWRSWDIFVGMLKAKTNREVPEIADLRAPLVLKNLKLSTGWDIAFEVDQQNVCFLSRRALLQVQVAMAWIACNYRAGTCTERQGDHWSPWKPAPRSFLHTELLDKVVENWNAPQYSTILFLTVDSQQYDQFRVPLKPSPNMVIVLVWCFQLHIYELAFLFQLTILFSHHSPVVPDLHPFLLLTRQSLNCSNHQEMVERMNEFGFQHA